MMEWGLILCGGMLGSTHCVGMCGGFALMVGAKSCSVWHNLMRQLGYSLGRLFTYSVAGAFVAYTGLRMSGWAASLGNLQALLCIVAGVVLVWQGAISAGWMPSVARANSPVACSLTGSFSTLIRSGGRWQPFLAGMFTGFLPCGLLYGYLLLAAASGSLIGGALRMLVFGLGTIPLMVMVGVGGQHLVAQNRQRLWQLAAWCVMATGLFSIGRGVWGWPQTVDSPVTCPFCEANSQQVVPTSQQD